MTGIKTETGMSWKFDSSSINEKEARKNKSGTEEKGMETKMDERRLSLTCWKL